MTHAPRPKPQRKRRIVVDGTVAFWCAGCQAYLEASNFGVNRAASYGKDYRCFECAAEKARRSAARNPRSNAERSARYRAKLKERLRATKMPETVEWPDELAIAVMRRINECGWAATYRPLHVTERTLRTILLERRSKVETYEYACFVVRRTDLLNELPVPVLEGWSLLHDCCQECGRTDRPCHLRIEGLCDLCYRRRRAGSLAPASRSKWSAYFSHCQNPDCATPKKRHDARGLCTTCYAQMRDKERLHEWPAPTKRKGGNRRRRDV